MTTIKNYTPPAPANQTHQQNNQYESYYDPYATDQETGINTNHHSDETHQSSFENSAQAEKKQSVFQTFESLLQSVREDLASNQSSLPQSLVDEWENNLEQMDLLYSQNSKNPAYAKKFTVELQNMQGMILDAVLGDLKSVDQDLIKKFKSLEKEIKRRDFNETSKEELLTELSELKSEYEDNPLNAPSIYDSVLSLELDLDDLEIEAKEQADLEKAEEEAKQPYDRFENGIAFYESGKSQEIKIDFEDEINQHEIIASDKFVIEGESLKDQFSVSYNPNTNIWTVEVSNGSKSESIKIQGDENTIIQINGLKSQVNGSDIALENIHIGEANQNGYEKLNHRTAALVKQMGMDEQSFRNKLIEIYPEFDKDLDGKLSNKEINQANFPPDNMVDQRFSKVLVNFDTELRKRIKQFRSDYYNGKLGEQQYRDIRERWVDLVRVAYPDKSIEIPAGGGNYVDNVIIDGHSRDMFAEEQGPNINESNFEDYFHLADR